MAEKCEKCNKNIKLLPFVCKCLKKFCIKCLPSNVHNCEFDYKKEQKEHLQKTLIKSETKNYISI
jgi:hypothetical protein